MPEKPSKGGRTEESPVDAGSEPSADVDTGSDPSADIDDGADRPTEVDDGVNRSDGVDAEVQRRLREAYLNDEESSLIVTGVRSTSRHVIVEFQPPHGEATHVERFSAPRNGSLAESEAFLEFLDAVGVSPLDVDELVGTRVPATYDAEAGWQIAEGYLPDDTAESGLLASTWARSTDWLWTYRYWLLAVLLVGGELLFVAAILFLYT